MWLVFAGAAAPASLNDWIADWDSLDSYEIQGSYATSITVNDVSGPIAGAKVTILLNGVAVAVDYAGMDGKASFMLDAGDYTVNIFANGYKSISASPLVVSGASSTVITMLPFYATPASGLCVVRFVVYENDGETPIANAKVTAKLNPNTAVNTIFLSNTEQVGYTNASGVCDLVLIQGDSIIKGNKHYQIDIFDQSELADPDACESMSSYKAIVPSLEFCFAEDLLRVSGGSSNPEQLFTVNMQAEFDAIQAQFATVDLELDGKVSTADMQSALADYTETADLGGAALLDVGTTAGTVAAGDDSRFSTSADSQIAVTEQAPSHLFALQEASFRPIRIYFGGTSILSNSNTRLWIESLRKSLWRFRDATAISCNLRWGIYSGKRMGKTKMR